jgi:hypothetical protein
MEKIYAEAVYAMQSDEAEWWEKSAAQSWLRFLEVARQLSIPASFEAIQFFRTTFAYDAVVMRLDKDFQVTKVWEAYAKESAKDARLRVQKSFRERRGGLTDMDYATMEQFGDVITQFFFQLQRNIENPIVQFRNIVGKIAYIASLLMKFGYLVAAVIGIATIADAVSRNWFDYQIDWAAMLERATTFGWVQLSLIAIILVIIRRIIFRLNLPDTRLGPER